MELEEYIYESQISAELTRIQQLILDQREYVRSRFHHKAHRLFIAGRAKLLIERELEDMQMVSDAYWAKELTNEYRKGYAKSATEIEEIMKYEGVSRNKAISQSDRSWLSRQRKKGKGDLDRALKETLDRSNKDLTGLKEWDVDKRLSASKGFRPVTGGSRKYALDTYGDLVTNIRGVAAYQRGSLAAMRDNGVEYLRVEDSPQCGWSRHDDAEKADGKVVSLNEAMAHMMSHAHCVRHFYPYGKEKPSGWDEFWDKRSKLFKIGAVALAAGAAGGAAAAGGYYAYTNRIFILQSFNDWLLKSEPLWKQYDLRINALVHNLEAAAKAGAGDVTDIFTGRPLQVNYDTVLLNARNDAVRYLEIPTSGIRTHTKYILGLTGEEDRFTLIRRIQDFNDYFDSYRKSGYGPNIFNSISNLESDSHLRVLDSVVNGYGKDYGWGQHTGFFDDLRKISAKRRNALMRGPANKFAENIEKILPDGKILRLTLPEIQGQNNEGLLRSIRGRIHIGEWFRGIATNKLGGERVGSMHFNHNGMARFGLQLRDDGRWYPRFSLIPKSPLRITARVNRGIHGQFNSISGEVKLLLPGPFNVKSNFNMNLRHLHLFDLADFRELTLRDIAGTSWDDFKIRSLALESRIKFMNRIDVSRVYRISWEDTVALFAKTNDDIFGTGERSVRILQKIGMFEEHYFGNFKKDMLSGFPKARRVWGGEIGEYYDRRLDVFQEFIDEWLTYGPDPVNPAEGMGLYYRFFKEPAVKEIQAIVDMIYKAKMNYPEFFSPEGAKTFMKILAEERYDQALMTFANEITKLSEDKKKVWNYTHNMIKGMHKKLFVDWPADRRRRAFKLFQTMDEGEILEFATSNTLMQDLKIYANNIFEIANEHGISKEAALQLKDASKRKINKVLQAIERMTRNTDRDQLILNMTSTRGWQQLGGVRSKTWEELIANHESEDLINLIGQWVIDAENLVPEVHLSIIRDYAPYFYKHGVDPNELAYLIDSLEHKQFTDRAREIFIRIAKSDIFHTRARKFDLLEKPIGLWETFESHWVQPERNQMLLQGYEEWIQKTLLRRGDTSAIRSLEGFDYRDNLSELANRIFHSPGLKADDRMAMIDEIVTDLDYLQDNGFKFVDVIASMDYPATDLVNPLQSATAKMEWVMKMFSDDQLLDVKKSLSVYRTYIDQFGLHDIDWKIVKAEAQKMASFHLNDKEFHGPISFLFGATSRQNMQMVTDGLMSGFFSPTRLTDVPQHVLTHELGHAASAQEWAIYKKEGVQFFMDMLNDLNGTAYKTFDEVEDHLKIPFLEKLKAGSVLHSEGVQDVSEMPLLEWYQDFMEFGQGMSYYGGGGKEERRLLFFLMDQAKEKVSDEISQYASTNFYELYAEMFANGLLSDVPSPWSIKLMKLTREMNTGVKTFTRVAAEVKDVAEAVPDAARTWETLHEEVKLFFSKRFDVVREKLDKVVTVLKSINELIGPSVDQILAFGGNFMKTVVDWISSGGTQTLSTRQMNYLRSQSIFGSPKLKEVVRQSEWEALQRTRREMGWDVNDFMFRKGYDVDLATDDEAARYILDNLEYLKKRNVEFKDLRLPYNSKLTAAQNKRIQEEYLKAFLEEPREFAKMTGIMRLQAEKLGLKTTNLYTPDNLNNIGYNVLGVWVRDYPGMADGLHMTAGQMWGHFTPKAWRQMDLNVNVGFYGRIDRQFYGQSTMTHELGHALTLGKGQLLDNPKGQDAVIDILNSMTGQSYPKTLREAIARNDKDFLEYRKRIMGMEHLVKYGGQLRFEDFTYYNDAVAVYSSQLTNHGADLDKIFLMHYIMRENRHLIAGRVSGYSVTNTHELIAELFREALLSYDPSPEAMMLLEAIAALL